MFNFFKKTKASPGAEKETSTPPAASPDRPGINEFHQNEELIPETELESILLDAKLQKVSFEDAMNYFIRADASILDTEFKPDEPGKLHNPLMQYGPNDVPLLALFSSAKRAQPHGKRRPEYRYLKVLPVASLIRAMAPGVGLVLNPGWKVGLQLPPEELDRIRSYIK